MQALQQNLDQSFYDNWIKRTQASARPRMATEKEVEALLQSVEAKVEIEIKKSNPLQSHVEDVMDAFHTLKEDHGNRENAKRFYCKTLDLTIVGPQYSFPIFQNFARNIIEILDNVVSINDSGLKIIEEHLLAIQIAYKEGTHSKENKVAGEVLAMLTMLKDRFLTKFGSQHEKSQGIHSDAYDCGCGK